MVRTPVFVDSELLDFKFVGNHEVYNSTDTFDHGGESTLNWFVDGEGKFIDNLLEDEASRINSCIPGRGAHSCIEIAEKDNWQGEFI